MSAPREQRIPLFRGPEPWLRAGAAAHRYPLSSITSEGLGEHHELEGRTRVVFSGDRPGLHPQILEVVRAASLAGVREVALQGPADAFVDRASPARLAEAGATHAVAVVGGIRRRVYEHALAAPGTFDAAMSALEDLARSALKLEVVVPLYATTRDDVVPLVEWLLEGLGGPEALAAVYLAVPEVAAVDGAAAKLLVPYSAQAEVAAAAFSRCRRAGVSYGFLDRRAPSPCAGTEALDPYGFVFHERVRNLQRRDRAELTRVAACEDCTLGDACPGIEAAYVKRFGTDGLSPVDLDRSLAWRLRQTDHVAQEYRHVSAFDNAGGGDGRSLVRINGHCQMACSFCFVDRTVADFDAEELEAAFETLAERHTDHLVLSGGEPTLHPDLPRLLARARSLGFRTIELQTNAVRLSDRTLTRALVESGLTKATVSLHSKDPSTSDEITKMKGAFPETVQGMHVLRELGVETQVAHVITKKNYRDLPDFVRWLTATYAPEEGGLSLCLALAQGISDLVYSWAIPRFTEVEPFVREALDHCLEAGLGFGGLIGQGGYPPCMLGGDLRYYRGALPNLYVSADHQEQFHKASPCGECSFDPYCVGIRKDYVRCYGDGEVRAFRADMESFTSNERVDVPAGRLVR
ncbi:MAG: radical SAM protein [Deltaproteobacteria bacterium]|nr:radical SAM protein [Deltaproteobacteria bacterium]